MAGVSALTGCEGGAERSPETTATTDPSVQMTYLEIQQIGTDTYEDYRDASVKGPHIEIGQLIGVVCVETIPVEADRHVEAKLYLIATPRELEGKFADASTFVRGNTDGPLSEQPAVDPAVPACKS